MKTSRSLGGFLRNARVKNNISQRRLGEIINRNSQAISNWERGICYPKEKILRKLLNALKIEKEDLINMMMTDLKKLISKD